MITPQALLSIENLHCDLLVICPIGGVLAKLAGKQRGPLGSTQRFL